MNKMQTEPLAGTAVRKVRKITANRALLRTFLMLLVPALLVLGGG